MILDANPLLSPELHTLSQDFIWNADPARNPNLVDDLYPIFRAFSLEHADEIISLISARRVQTNKVARCALFLPAFGLVSRRLDGEPFAMMEVGASAGLNLNWDKYAYDYGDGKIYGEPLSRVTLV